MVFSSHLFLFYFLPFALVSYYAMPRRGKHITLTLLSYIFYGWANPLFVVLMFSSTIIDYLCGLFISQQWKQSWSEPVAILKKSGTRTRAQRLALIISICSNLTLLGFFKYFNFFSGNYDALMAWIGFDNLKLDLWYRITLPLGISFYTFQSMSYSIDVYRGDAKAIRNFTDFSCFVAMFPQLVAGPIIRFKEISKQLLERRHTLEKFARGVAFICLGIAKKLLLANPCGKIADMTFHAGSVGFLDSWFGAIAYSFQIYFDFSGYSDMAIGLGLIFGFVYAKNFDSPYLATSITDFWRRWHLSLSSWLFLYLYIPLGGNRKGFRRTYFNLLAVMLLGGFWHGASWNFVIWGAIHGFMLAFERIRGEHSFYEALPKPIKVLITFVIILFAWVFFRAPDLASAVTYIKSMFGVSTIHPGAGMIGGLIYKPYYLLTCLIAACTIGFGVQTWNFTRQMTWPKVAAIIAAMIVAVMTLVTQSFNPFIYFDF